MSKFDKWSKNRMNDYYGKGREERRERQRGGCGNPNCRECYNPDGSLTDAGSRYSGRDGSETISWEPSSAASLARSVEEAARRLGISPLLEGPSSPSRELSEARKAVEKWIIPASSQSVKWDDVIGNSRAKEELRDAIEASTRDADLYRFYSMTPPKGVLLWGPPGCGKTMFGKAAASAVADLFGRESEMLLLNGAEIESPILSIAGQRIAAVFRYARLYRKEHGVPVILFIDEADALLRSRARYPISTEVVAQFLAELDGLKDLGAFVILATNQPDEIDEALLRDGRCERKIRVERPDQSGAVAILKSALGDPADWHASAAASCEAVIDRLYSPDYILRVLVNPESRANHHFLLSHIVNGAMIVGLLSRAKALAFRRDREAGTRYGLTEADLFAAVDLIFEENKGLNHDFAVREFVKDVALPAEALKSLN